MFPKVKKSGKEPKVGAEVTLGEVSHKTTVRHHIPYGTDKFYN